MFGASALSSFNPYFRVLSWEDAHPIMREIWETTSAKPGWRDFGFSRLGDRMLWRSSFDDVDALLDNYAVVSPLFDSLIQGPAQLDKVEFESPLSHLPRVKAATLKPGMGFNARYYESDPDGTCSGYFEKTSSSPRALSESMCSIKPEYTISDWQKVQPLMQEMVSKSAEEPGCTAFSWSKDGEKLHSRALFKNGEAMKKHFKKVHKIMDTMNTGPAKLESLEIHGPSTELEKIKDAAAAYTPNYFETHPLSSMIGSGSKSKPKLKSEASTSTPSTESETKRVTRSAAKRKQSETAAAK